MNGGKIVVKTEVDTSGFKNGLDRMQNSAKGAGVSLKSIVAGLGITKLISMGFNAIRNSMDDAITRMDTLNNFPKVMSNLGVSTKDAEASIKKMSDKLSGLPTTLDQGASAVQRFTSKNGDVKKSTNIFLALNNAILAGGAPTEQQASAMEQLSQAYAKGKPDMMEWRTAMSAMPAQLKQVAVAMGYVNADELGEALRKGEVSMDDFMDKISELNVKGANGFQSFEKQARNSTGGIRTSITVAKTQIVKGVADMIEGLNKGLKKAKLGSIQEIIAKVGKAFKKELDKIASMLSKIDFKKVINAFKTLAPVIMGVVTALVAYRTALLVTKGINFVAKVIEVTKAFLLMIGVLKNAVVAQEALNIVQAASPVGIILAVVGALVAMVGVYRALHPETDKNLIANKKLREEYKNFNNELKENEKQRKQNIEDVYTEAKNAELLLSKIEALSKVENKSAYQKQEMSRLVAELNELMPGLNLQYDQETDKLNKDTKAIKDNIDAMKEYNFVKAYQKNLKGIAEDEAKAQVKLSQAQKQHTKDVKAYNKVHAEADKIRNMSYKESLKLTFEDKKRNEKILEAEKKKKKAMEDSAKTVKDYEKQISKLEKKYSETAKLGEQASDKFNFKKLVAKAEEAGINVPKKFKEKMEKGFYSVPQSLDQMQKLINFDKALETAGISGKQIPKSISEGVMSGQISVQEAIAQANNWIDFQSAINKAGLSGQKIPQSIKDGILSGQLSAKEGIDQMKRWIDFKDVVDKSIFEGKKIPKNIREGVLSGKYSVEEAMALMSNTLLGKINGKKYEFKKVGEGQMQLYADGVKVGKPMSVEKANDLIKSVGKKLKSGKTSAKQAGKDLATGLARGIDANSKEATAAAERLAERVLKRMKKKLKEKSPSKATEEMGINLDEGLVIGILKYAGNTLKAVANYGSSILDEFEDATDMTSTIDKMQKQMQSAIDLQQGKMNTNVQTGKVFNSLVATTPVELNLDGSVEMDGQKVGRVVTPYVSKTIKTGGGV